ARLRAGGSAFRTQGPELVEPRRRGRKEEPRDRDPADQAENREEDERDQRDEQVEQRVHEASGHSVSLDLWMSSIGGTPGRASVCSRRVIRVMRATMSRMRWAAAVARSSQRPSCWSGPWWRDSSSSEPTTTVRGLLISCAAALARSAT